MKRLLVKDIERLENTSFAVALGGQSFLEPGVNSCTGGCTICCTCSICTATTTG